MTSEDGDYCGTSICTTWELQNPKMHSFL